MHDNQLEDKLKVNAEVIFGHGKELSPGHRERFEQRLKKLNAGQKESPGMTKKTIWITTSVAAASILFGVVFLLGPHTKKPQETELSIVHSYYHLLLEEKAFVTRQLIQHIDESQRGILYSNVEFIENEPVPEIQLPDSELIKFITSFYSKKIETLENLQNIIASTNQ